MDKDAYELFMAIGTCHRVFKDHAAELKTRRDVQNVTHWLDVYDIENAFRLEEFVDAELWNGEAISWRLELTLSEDELAVEADVRQVHGDGFAAIADDTYAPAELATKLLDITKKLCSANPI